MRPAGGAGHPRGAVVPFYHWSGNPFNGSLTAHNYHKELLLIGMGRAEDYSKLPLLHNEFAARTLRQSCRRSRPSRRPRDRLRPFFLFGLPTEMGGLVVGVIGILAAADQHPFRSSRFDPYTETRESRRFRRSSTTPAGTEGWFFGRIPNRTTPCRASPMGPITLVTGHYAQDLAAAKGYTGFAALYGDAFRITEPGGLWDRILTSYCRGERAEPVLGDRRGGFSRRAGRKRNRCFSTAVLAADNTAAAVLGCAQPRAGATAVQKGRAIG